MTISFAREKFTQAATHLPSPSPLLNPLRIRSLFRLALLIGATLRIMAAPHIHSNSDHDWAPETIRALDQASASVFAVLAGVIVLLAIDFVRINCGKGFGPICLLFQLLLNLFLPFSTSGVCPRFFDINLLRLCLLIPAQSRFRELPLPHLPHRPLHLFSPPPPTSICYNLTVPFLTLSPYMGPSTDSIIVPKTHSPRTQMVHPPCNPRVHHRCSFLLAGVGTTPCVSCSRTRGGFRFRVGLIRSRVAEGTGRAVFCCCCKVVVS